MKQDKLDRFKQYVLDGRTANEVMQLEGYSDESYPNRLLKKVRKEMGLPPTATPRRGTIKLPVGLDNESLSLRIRLAHEVDKLISAVGSQEAARVLGVSLTWLNRSIQTPKNPTPRLNWTLAQIQRLAKALGYTLEEFLQLITLHYRTHEKGPWAANGKFTI